MKLRKEIVFCIAVPFSLTILIWYNYRDTSDPLQHYIGGEVETEWQAKLNSETKVILIYTTLFNHLTWHSMQGSNLHTYFNDNACEHQNCLVTYNRSRLPSSAAVLFHGRDIEQHKGDRYSPGFITSLRKRVPQNQKWIFFSHENPKYTSSFYAPYNGIFDWSASFREASDLFVPYGAYKKTNQSEVSKKNYARGKTGLVAWAVSNCNLMRQDYAQELQYYVNLTVYGKCRHYLKQRKDCKRTKDNCHKELATYKFILAFENDFCEDYVTEKYWKRIAQETVPIVMGATYDSRLVIPGSFIDASKFDSIKALGDYLLYLDGNDTAYNEYFAWKSHYARSEGPSTNLYCQICSLLHSDKYQQPSQMILSDFFNYERTCEYPYKKKRDKLTHQVQISRKNRESNFAFIPRHFHNFVAKIKEVLD